MLALLHVSHVTVCMSLTARVCVCICTTHLMYYTPYVVQSTHVCVCICVDQMVNVFMI